MRPFGRPKSRPGLAAVGEYQCKNNWQDPQKDQLIVCGKPVPPGELTHLSLNSRSGHYLALCAECRTDLEEEMLHWMAARVGVGQLQSALLELPNKELVSHGDLRKVLIENGALTRKQGPLTQEELEYAVELRDGPEAREWVEKHG